MNINSVITTPGHDEILPVDGVTTQRGYTMKGYAYSGESPSCVINLTRLCLVREKLWILEL